MKPTPPNKPRAGSWSAPAFWRLCLTTTCSLCLAVTLSAAETPASAKAPKRGGTLHLAIESDQRTLDPAQLFSGHEGMLAQLVFNSLLDYTADGRFIPALAESLPEISPDGLVLKFKLHPGVRFSNGRLLAADDVVYSFERYLNPAEGALGSVFYLPDQPYLDGIEVAIGIDFTTQAMMFERGEIDVQPIVMDPDYLRFRRDPKLGLAIDSLLGVLPQYILMNCELPPFTNRLVRLALNHAVDKEAMLKALFTRGVVARGPLAPSVKGFNERLPEYRHDPSKARALLAEAGLPRGFETTLWVRREDARYMKIALIVQQNLREVGVTVQLREVNSSAFNDSSMRRGQVSMAVADWGATFDDPKDTLDLLNGDNISDEACMNLAFHSNSELNVLFRRASAEADAGRRLRLYQEVEERIVREAPWIFLVHLNDDHLRQPWLKGYLHRPIWPNARLEQCWMER